jgi:hypothetical protein
MSKPKRECNRCGATPAPHKLKATGFVYWKYYCDSCKYWLVYLSKAKIFNKVVADIQTISKDFTPWKP